MMGYQIMLQCVSYDSGKTFVVEINVGNYEKYPIANFDSIKRARDFMRETRFEKHVPMIAADNGEFFEEDERDL